MEDKTIQLLRSENLKASNYFNIRGYGVYSVIVIIASLWGNYHSGSSGLTTVVTSLVTVTGFLVSLRIYYKDRSSEMVPRIIIPTVALTYACIMLLGRSDYRFVMVFPPMCALITFHNPKYLKAISIPVFLLNFFNVIVCITILGKTDHSDMVRYLLQLTAVGMTIIATIYGAKVYDDSYKKTENQNILLSNLVTQTIATIANTLDAKDPYTQGHSRRVSIYSSMIAESMGFNKDEVDRVRYIALLHDVGKIAVPDSVLNKPSRLTQDEYELMKSHAAAGGDILKEVVTIRDIDLGARYHHERFDGKGYPEGLKGEDIPLVARIICLADTFDAMTSNRVYRSKLPLSAVLDEIKRCSGTQFDPRCVDAFLAHIEKVGEKALFEEAGSRRAVSVDDGEGEIPAVNDETDPLLGIYKKAPGERKIAEAMAGGKGAIAIFNVSKLKEINNSYGYRRGDYCVRLMTDLLGSAERDGQDSPLIAARIAGNEIVVFVPGIGDEAGARRWIESYFDLVAGKRESEPALRNVFRVVGAIAVHTDNKKNIGQYVRRLERARYRIGNAIDTPYVYYDCSAKGLMNVHRMDDIDDVMEIIQGEAWESDGYKPLEDEAAKKLTDRLKGEGNVLVMLYNLTPSDGDSIEPEELNMIMSYLDESLEYVLEGRRNVFMYSSLQRLVIIPVEGDSEDELETAASLLENRIMSYFYKRYGKNDANLSYSQRIIRKGQ